jgi:hypothetical protein
MALTRILKLSSSVIIVFVLIACTSQVNVETLNRKSTIGSSYQNASELIKEIQTTGIACQKILDIEEASTEDFSSMKSCVYSKPGETLKSVDSLVLDPEIANVSIIQAAMEGFRNSEGKSGKKFYYLVGPNWITFSEEIDPLITIQKQIGGKLE